MRAAVHPVLERGGILQRDGHAGIELLPDPRHREKRRRLHLAEIVGHRFRAFGEIHHRAQRQRRVVAADPFGDVAERQEHQALFTIGGGKQVVGVAHLMRDAAVGMHGTFGRTGGAGGIDQDGKIAGAAACDHLIPQCLAAVDVIASHRHEFGQRHHHRIGKTAQAFHVEDDDLLQGRTARAARQDLVELLFVLGEDHPGAGVVDEIFHLGGRIGRIDARRNAAGAQDAHIGEHPFRHRVGDDRGDVAGPEIDGVQSVGDVFRYLQPLPPTGRLPDAERLLADRRLVAAAFRRQQKTLRNRVRHSQHCGSGHCTFPPPPGSAPDAGSASEAGLERRSCSRDGTCI